MIQDPASFSFRTRRHGEAAAADGIGHRAGAPEKDAPVYVAFLDAQPQVNKSRKIGTQGYCMGGPLVVRTAATLPIASARARRSTAAGSHRHARQPASTRAENQGADVLAWPRTTMPASPRRRTSCARRLPRPRCRLKSRLPGASRLVRPGYAARGWEAVHSKPDAERAWTADRALQSRPRVALTSPSLG